MLSESLNSRPIPNPFCLREGVRPSYAAAAVEGVAPNEGPFLSAEALVRHDPRAVRRSTEAQEGFRRGDEPLVGIFQSEGAKREHDR